MSAANAVCKELIRILKEHNIQCTEISVRTGYPVRQVRRILEQSCSSVEQCAVYTALQEIIAERKEKR